MLEVCDVRNQNIYVHAVLFGDLKSQSTGSNTIYEELAKDASIDETTLE